MAKVLVIEDEEIVAGLIMRLLAKGDIDADEANCLADARQHLQTPDDYAAIILDRQLPDGDGLTLLQELQQHDTLKHIPVIFNTALERPEEVRQGVDAGAYWYLTKPIDPKMLLSVVKAAMEHFLSAKEASHNLNRALRTNRFLLEGKYRVRTVEDARQLAEGLSMLCPDPDRAWLGLSEMLLNAVEHGSLKVTYEDKTRLMLAGEYHEEIQRRQQDPKYMMAYVDVDVVCHTEYTRITIQDQGEGFDWSKYLEFSVERALDPHGRGIAMTCQVSFDRVEYAGNGNTVSLTMNKSR
ncbi:response regulator [Pontibacter sp. JAM-7]|uniref:response regulator n=1 Tax=Pontibacter sp. JAM-7 TaxID=3366581 RepID=UPI003AF76F9B